MAKAKNQVAKSQEAKSQDMPRLFTALEIPAALAESLSMLRGGLPGARWIDPENYHMTLRFIGDVDDALARDIASVLGQVRRSGFEMRFNGLSSFGGRKPRAVVASAMPSQSVMELQAEHERLMQRVGLEPEGRKFTPHVTLARLRDSSSWQVAEYLSERGGFRSPPFSVARFVLFSSRASVGGGPYVVEEAYPLAAYTCNSSTGIR
jgi:2'-5' RNA ligase